MGVITKKLHEQNMFGFGEVAWMLLSTPFYVDQDGVLPHQWISSDGVLDQPQ